MTTGRTWHLERAGLSDVGKVRDHNEDSWGHFLNANGSELFVVADGMGGHRGGGTASQTVVESMGSTFEMAEPDPVTGLCDSIREANRQVRTLSANNENLRGMGTTVVALSIDRSGHATIGHVGDSRVYLWRDGRLSQLTEDHSVVAELVRRGAISEADAQRHPRRNEIMRSVGVADDLEVDFIELDLVLGDRLLLCSDGLTGLVGDDVIEHVIGGHVPTEAVRALVDLANGRGGNDNVTAQVVALQPNPEEPEYDAYADPGPRESKNILSDDAYTLVSRMAAAGVLVAGALLIVVFTVRTCNQSPDMPPLGGPGQGPKPVVERVEPETQ